LGRAYSKVSEPDSEEIAPATTQTTTEKRRKHTMPQKLKEHHTKAFAEHHEHAPKHYRKPVIAASVCVITA
jgi:hypothetical protein